MPGIEDVDKEYIPYIGAVVSRLEKIVNEDTFGWSSCYKKIQDFINRENKLLHGAHWTLKVLDNDTTKQNHMLSLAFNDYASWTEYDITKFIYINKNK